MSISENGNFFIFIFCVKTSQFFTGNQLEIALILPRTHSRRKIVKQMIKAEDNQRFYKVCLYFWHILQLPSYETAISRVMANHNPDVIRHALSRQTHTPSNSYVTATQKHTERQTQRHRLTDRHTGTYTHTTMYSGTNRSILWHIAQNVLFSLLRHI